MFEFTLEGEKTRILIDLKEIVCVQEYPLKVEVYENTSFIFLRNQPESFHVDTPYVTLKELIEKKHETK